jgi:uncharacterized protein YcfJ
MHFTQATQAIRSARVARFVAAVGTLAFVGGCASMSHTDRGVLTGGGLGAATGAIIGSATGNAGAGALIGTGLGAIAGGLTGAAVDSAERKAEVRTAAALQAQQQQAQLGLSEIAQLARNGVGDGVIIEQVRVSGTVYHLTADQILWLRDNGVSEAVIREMQATAHRPPGPPVVYQRVVPYQRVYVVDPYPPPPVVGIGVGYTFGPRRCR